MKDMNLREFIESTKEPEVKIMSRRELWEAFQYVLKHGRVAEGRVGILRGGHVLKGVFWTNGPVGTIRAIPIGEVRDLKYLDQR